MQIFRVSITLVAILSLGVATLTFGTLSAEARAVMSIHHADGDVDTYSNVEVKVIHGSLYMTTQDGKGTLIVHRAACSYQGKILFCFATAATLIQAGETTPIDLKTGTVYANSTDDPQQLALSTLKVPPHSVLASLSTYKGTYITLSGRVDQVVK